MEAKILLIEDNPEMARSITDILKLVKYDVIHACNGKEGVELARIHLPDLIICDVMMPELDGYGVIHIVSQIPATADIPFIFLSAKSTHEDLRAGMNLGADDYLFKPYEGAELLKIVDLRLKKSLKTKKEQSGSFFYSDQSAGLTWDFQELKQFSQSWKLKTFKKKDFIFKEGQPSTHIYFIESGKVKCYMSNSYGKELITGIAGPKELIGYATILNDSEYIENAEAQEEIKIWSISRLEFISIIENNKALSFKFIRFLSNNLIQLEERLMELAYQPVRQRVAQNLIKLGKHVGNPSDSGKINMSRKDISNVIGTATETLNRMVAEFKDDNLIETTELGLLIKDLKGLERVAKS
jgi:CRP-like cAMP-binding protein/FixJ family two-component response regulator